MEFYSKSLADLNEDAVKRKFEASALKLDRPVDRTKLWIPDELMPMAYLPSYQLLTAKQKLRANQLRAVALCEQFIWFEQDLIVPVLQKVKDWKGVSPELMTAIDHFVEDEHKHSLMFRNLASWAEPERFTTNRYWLFKNTLPMRVFFKAVHSAPASLIFWVWLAVLFEEKTLDFSRKYRAINAKDPSHFDQKFVEAHHLHYLDELRHHMLDEYLLETFYSKAGSMTKKLAGYMFSKVLKRFTSPSSLILSILDVMQIEFTDLDYKIVAQIKAEIPMLCENRDFHNEVYGIKSIPRSLNLMKNYPELNSCWQYLKFTRPEGWVDPA